MIARRSGILIAWCLACAMPIGAGSPRQQNPSGSTFRATAHVVLVDVAVTDGRAPVAGLRAADFELIDNGVKQTVETVTADAVPLDVSLVLDTSGSVLPVLDQFKADIRSVAARLRSGDRLRLVTFGTDIALSVPLQPVDKPLVLDEISLRGGRTALNDALLYALVQPAAAGRRQVIVVITDSLDNWSWFDSARLPAVAARADAVFYAVVAGRPMVTSPFHAGELLRIAGSNLDAMTEAAQATGGAVYNADTSTDFVSAFALVLDDFRRSYVLSYVPQGVTRDGWHDLKVTVPKSRKYTVRARKGYVG